MRKSDEQYKEKHVVSDEALMGYLAAGDQSALQPLYDRHRTLLYAVALQITGDPRNAEEILQDAFLQLWRKASRFEPSRGSLVGWLLTITRHRAISRLRQKSGRCHDGALDPELVGPPNNIGFSLLNRQIAQQLVSVALSELPKAQREAVILAYFDGLTSEEIAGHTGAPIGTIKSRLRSGLKAMKKTLSHSQPARSPKCEQLPVALDDILITDKLLSRNCRYRSSDQEKEALRILNQCAVNYPTGLVDCFLKMSIDLCRAGSAGFSFLEMNQSKQVFRWTNLAGRLEKYIGGTTPRNFSPCGVTLDRNCPQLFAYPARYFQYFNDVKIPIVEGLVIPFHVGTSTEGTVWIVSHTEGIQFDSEDARIMTVLTEFAACAFDLLNRSILKTVW